MTRQFEGYDLLIATHNAGKAGEFQKLLGEMITVQMASDVAMPDVEETGATYLENATLKAVAGAKHSDLPTLGEDSGFEIDALDGRPGLYSARFMKAQGSAAQTFQTLHDELGDGDRTARFVCALVLAWPDGHIEHVHEEAVGQFVYPPQGVGGFGYDPVFIADGQTNSFAEIPLTLKNQLSHRGKAVRAMLKKCFSK